MIARKMIGVLAILSLAALLFGCGKSPAASVPAPATNALASLPVPAADTILRIHWLGKKSISADTNATALMRVWNLPESMNLAAQTLDKLSSAPWRLLRSETNQSAASLLRPLLDDLANEESYVEVRRTANSTNAADEMVLAIHLDNQRAALWQTNLAAVLESLTGIRPTKSSSFGTNTAAGWSLKKHHAPNLIELARVGDWTLVSAAENHNILLDEVLARLNQATAPFSVKTTNSWLEASGDLSRIASALGIAAKVHSNLPQVAFSVAGDPRYVLTRGEIILPDNWSVKLEPWNMPTNLIDGNLASFTAVRGLKSGLELSTIWKNLQVGPPPDQLYVWALHAFPMETYFAAPLPEASNVVSHISDLVLEKGAPWFAIHNLAGFQRSTTFNGISWQGVPYVKPFLQSFETNGGNFAFGGCFQAETVFDSPPFALLNEVLNHTNLVYYDWELSGPRVADLIYLGQLVRLISGKAQLAPDSAALAWLRVLKTNLGVSGTEITQSAPGRFSFTRNSTVGFSAIELHLLADWLESPDFPRGLFSLSGQTNMPSATPIP
ncbi:MAG TPA: hypothetical protein VG938_12735 [Verrucomicrobiae bacterium]|jgi:hypothetical protein|nr:hypothetical protein [Verrucomicrobiae bacterium]